MAAEKTTIVTKTTGDQLTANEFNELNSKYNATVDVVKGVEIRGTSATLDFEAKDDFAITCGASQQLTIENDYEGVVFKTFELTGGSIGNPLFLHGSKAITETNNLTASDYTAGSINDVVAKFVIGASTVVIDWILKVRK